MYQQIPCPCIASVPTFLNVASAPDDSLFHTLSVFIPLKRYCSGFESLITAERKLYRPFLNTAFIQSIMATKNANNTIGWNDTNKSAASSCYKGWGVNISQSKGWFCKKGGVKIKRVGSDPCAHSE